MKVRLNAPGLRIQAVLISISLVLLVVLLGTKAYSVSRTHFAELSELANRDLNAQALLVRMETLMASRDQAQRKYRITRALEYKTLAQHYKEALDEASHNLGKDLKFDGTVQGLSTLRSTLEARREAKVIHAHEAALGLMRLIFVALVISMVITAWLLTLFYKGLLEPLSQLKEATSRIRSGELSFRLHSDKGVTELREMAESFNLMAERLESLDSAKTEFLAMISHEIKNPLAAIKEGMHLLAVQGESMLPQVRNKAFSACLIAAKRLESMINNLLHHSRMETGLFTFDLTPKDLSSAVKTAMDEVRPLAHKKGMSIEFVGNDDLQAAFNWDGMVQVVENLLLNAVKYGKENTVIEIRSAASHRKLEKAALPHLELAVINEGNRIPEADMKTLFDPFFRGSNSKLQQGMGLGLHVVKRIVEAHHGGIHAACDEGKTRFELWIPGSYETEAV